MFLLFPSQHFLYRKYSYMWTYSISINIPLLTQQYLHGLILIKCNSDYSTQGYLKINFAHFTFIIVKFEFKLGHISLVTPNPSPSIRNLNSKTVRKQK